MIHVGTTWVKHSLDKRCNDQTNRRFLSVNTPDTLRSENIELAPSFHWGVGSVFTYQQNPFEYIPPPIASVSLRSYGCSTSYEENLGYWSRALFKIGVVREMSRSSERHCYRAKGGYKWFVVLRGRIKCHGPVYGVGIKERTRVLAPTLASVRETYLAASGRRFGRSQYINSRSRSESHMQP